MADDLESISLRPTVVDGQTVADDYEVIWRGILIGRIMKQPDGRHWWWGCNVYGHPPSPNDRGPAINFKDCQVRFNLAWSRIRPALTEETIAIAMRHAEELRQQQPVQAEQASEAAPVQVLDNNRAAQRHRTLKAGSIAFGGGAIDCLVRNISATGAALEVASPVGIPDTFTLLISGEEAGHHCRVAWRRENRIGVAFQ